MHIYKAAAADIGPPGASVGHKLTQSDRRLLEPRGYNRMRIHGATAADIGSSWQEDPPS